MTWKDIKRCWFIERRKSFILKAISIINKQVYILLDKGANISTAKEWHECSKKLIHSLDKLKY